MSDFEAVEYGSERDIAIIGMAGRFPGAANLDAYWQNLIDGVESVTFFSDDELLAAGVPTTVLDNPHFVKAGSVLDGIEDFDAAFFNINPREAELLDPQQRLFLEYAWAALEHAGHIPETYPGLVGVYAGVGWNKYLLFNLSSNSQLHGAANSANVFIASDKDFAATRASYKLNLKGPSMAVQTACSTSLVAVHLARLSLLNYECDMALAGGVTLQLPQKTGYLYQEGGILSPDGHCRAFDAEAQGTIFGSGVGVVVLKRLADALDDGDTIHAVIKGSAINNDGALKVGYTAPSIDGQTKVIAEALAVAEVEPDSISYIETHGTGTALGDPIEVAALTRAFRAGTSRTGFCALGSVKTNIGHLDTAAGIAGLLKTVLALKHRQLPPSLHCVTPNPKLELATSPFYINTALQPWAATAPRRAGVSSFGVGGTNAHVILEQAPAPRPAAPARAAQLLLLSAKTPTALAAATAELSAYCQAQQAAPSAALADVAFTLQRGRTAFAYRRAVVCHDWASAISALQGDDGVTSTPSAVEGAARPVVFLFPGQGAQYPHMAAELYQHEPTFRQTVDQCAVLLQPHLGRDLRHVLYPAATVPPAVAAQQLTQTALAQPALFVIGYALAQLWQRWGVQPQALLGHSIGEYVAATLAGVFTLDDALALVALRGQLMQQQPAGAMLAVAADANAVQPYLDGEVTLAAANSAQACVVAGTPAAIARLAEHLTAQGVPCQRLHTSHAFHSPLMDAVVAPFQARVQQCRLQPPQLPFLSNLSGTWITPAQATDPAYWAQHLRQPVQFAANLTTVLADPTRVLLEVGPGQSLSTLARQHAGAGNVVAVACLPTAQEQVGAETRMLQSVGRLWTAGVAVDWAAFHAVPRRRVPLPTYPFERRRFWIEPGPRGAAPAPVAATTRRADIADWFYEHSWKRWSLPAAPEPETLAAHEGGWVILADGDGVGAALAGRLRAVGQTVVLVQPGRTWQPLNAEQFVLNADHPADYDALVAALPPAAPLHVIHCWSLMPADPSLAPDALPLGFRSLLYLAQALGRRAPAARQQLTVLSRHLYPVTGSEPLEPLTALLLGLCTVLPQEYPQLTCRHLDLDTLPLQPLRPALLDALLSELVQPGSEPRVAYRGHQRWLPTYEPTPLPPVPARPKRLRPGGVYLITGGVGGIGLTLAAYLARTVQAKLVLTSRSALPLADPRHAQVAALRALGAEVLVLPADVTDPVAMADVVATTLSRFGALHGVIHAAGVAGGGLIQGQTAASVAAVLAPKVTGTQVVHAVTQELALDFLVLCSSLTVLTGGLGQMAYCAANAFLDAFAYQAATCSGRFVLSINWSAWQEVGMAINSELSASFKGAQEDILKRGISPEDGQESFSRLLSTTSHNMVVSPQDLSVVLNNSRALTTQSVLEKLEQISASTPAHPRPELATTYIAARNEIEQKIINIWQAVLGVEPVGIDDNFFELGGNSLIGIQLVAQLKQEFNVTIPTVSLYEGPTVSAIAKILRQDEDEDPAFSQRRERGEKRRDRQKRNLRG